MRGHGTPRSGSTNLLYFWLVPFLPSFLSLSVYRSPPPGGVLKMGQRPALKPGIEIALHLNGNKK